MGIFDKLFGGSGPTKPPETTSSPEAREDQRLATFAIAVQTSGLNQTQRLVAIERAKQILKQIDAGTPLVPDDWQTFFPLKTIRSIAQKTLGGLETTTPQVPIPDHGTIIASLPAEHQTIMAPHAQIEHSTPVLKPAVTPEGSNTTDESKTLIHQPTQPEAGGDTMLWQSEAARAQQAEVTPLPFEPTPEAFIHWIDENNFDARTRVTAHNQIRAFFKRFDLVSYRDIPEPIREVFIAFAKHKRALERITGIPKT